tara:strand:+ start:97 stop:1296 length:1200 start_codon:yes stop_codon:yes gene_type:complete
MLSYKYKEKIDLIFNPMLDALKNKYNELPLGLLSGKSGMVILFGHLNKLFPNKYNETVEELIGDIFDSIENERNTFSMSNGISGAAYAIQSLQAIEGFNSETDILCDLDKYILKSLHVEIKNNNWDPLHGFIGQGLYLLQRHKYFDLTSQLTKIVDILYNSRVDYESYKVWITPEFQPHSNDNYNFGMAHGMSGIVSFLSLVAQQGIEKKRCEEMTYSCLDFFKFFYRDLDKMYFFPTRIDLIGSIDKGEGRLAWCYGDLCVANVFFHASKAFDNKDWFNIGKEIALHTTEIKFEDSGIIDPMICHGSAGVILQYYRYYKLTGDLKFKKALEYHLDIILNNFYEKDLGIGGFQYSLYKDEKYIQVNEVGLLEGTTGIALVFLTLLYDLEDWDLFLMTNV